MAATRRILVLVLIVALVAGCSGRGRLDRPGPAAGEATAPANTTPGPTASPVTATAGAALSASPPPESGPLSSLVGLPLERFLEASFELLLLRDPEWVTADGLAERLGTDNDRLTDLSDAYLRETQELQAGILEMLRRYDRASLSPEQQISYDVYEWYLDDLVRGQAFAYYDYPINHIVTGVQNQLINFFTDIHPVASRQDAEDYVARLWQVESKFEGLIEGLELRADAGVILPKSLFPWFMNDIRSLAHAAPLATPFYRAFRQKVSGLAGVDESGREALLAAAEEAIGGSVIPAFAALEKELDRLQRQAPANGGAWRLPDGEAYYTYALRHHTTTNMTPDEIHALGLQELERVHGEMRTLFDQLGYPEDASFSELYARLARESGTVSGAEVGPAYEAIIEGAEARLDQAFDIRPQANVIVITGDVGDFYISASLDGSRPGAFYARTTGGKARYELPTLAYHETVPGHHFQIAIAQEADLPLFRNTIGFTGYAEGWALYAEQLAYELGWYQDDIYGNLGRLRDQAFRAARLVVDTGLHAKKWSAEKAHQFMVDNVGSDPGYLEFEVSRYLAWPGQATAYMVGMLKIMELRQRAQDQLGDAFDLKEFHRVVLSNGSMPLDVLERVVDDYIAAKSAEAVAPAAESGANGLTSEEVATLGSLQQVDDYPLYTMTYYGDYPLQVASMSEGAHVAFIGPGAAHLSLAALPVFAGGTCIATGDFETRPGAERREQPAVMLRAWERDRVGIANASSPDSWACSLFAALGDGGERLYGRNFDWDYSPALLLFTQADAEDRRYASASMVDVAYLGFSGAEGQTVTDLPLADRRPLLHAPFLPFDGMNEEGLAVGMAAVPPGEMVADPAKSTVGSLEVIRLMLDRAATVDEAVAILGGYNVDMEGGPPLHYLIADRSGRSALVEFYEGEMVVLSSEASWQAATNFLQSAVEESVQGQCWRYDRIAEALTAAGRREPVPAMALLGDVAQDSTQWSVVYGLNRGDVTVAMGSKYDRTHTLHLTGAE